MNPFLYAFNFSGVTFQVLKLITFITVIAACKSEPGEPKEPLTVMPAIALEVVAEGLVSPLGVTEAPDKTGRLFVYDQSGLIYLVNASGELQQEPYLDLSEVLIELNRAYDERGLLGVAFHPEFASNSRLYVHYNAAPRAGGPNDRSAWNNVSRISEFRQSATNPDKVDVSSEKVILEVDQPQMNHQGGSIAFGPDGYLYIGLGDGGAANDLGPGHEEDWYTQNGGGNGQDITSNLLGSILRIDIDSGSPYGIPVDNPFVGTEGLDEIYAYGFRNPYIFSFDMEGDHQLFAGDVGQVLWEEINLVTKGGNYGWNVMEGRHCFNAADNTKVLEECPEADVYGNRLIEPVIELPNTNHPEGGETLSVIGGFVYRGKAIPALSGKYVFGSFSRNFNPSGALYSSQPASSDSWEYTPLEIAAGKKSFNYLIKGLGQDRHGELYITASTTLGPTGRSGVVFKLVPSE